MTDQPTPETDAKLADRAAIVLQQIDAALALAEKATPVPWADKFNHESVFGPMHQVMTEERPGYFWAINGLGGDMSPADAAFIATSRTLLPLSLRCLKTAIKGLQPIAISETCADDAMGCNHPFDASDALTTLLDQWEAGK